MKLEERVERLERQNRRLKRFGFGALLLAAIAASLGFAQNQDDYETRIKERQAKLRLFALNKISVTPDTIEMMDKLIENAKGGDPTATRTILNTIFKNTD